MKIKTAELEGAALDWAVAAVTSEHDDREHAQMEIGMGHYSPSTDWSQGGPLMSARNIILEDMIEGKCRAVVDNRIVYPGRYEPRVCATGPTLLIAAMRAIVASELGDEVDVPDELA